MEHPTPGAPRWALAATLRERGVAQTSTSPVSAPPDERARRRLERWKAQPPFAAEMPFAGRLARDGLTEAELLRLLGEPGEALASRLPGALRWVEALDRALASAGPPEPIPLPEPLRGQADAALLEAVEPLLRDARGRLRHAARELAASRPDAPFDPDAATDLLFQDLPLPLLYLTGRTLVLELNVARLQERLEGDTPAERFRSFLRGLRDPGALRALLEVYPVLARQLVARLDHWVESGRELLARLAADREALGEAFLGGGDPGRVVGVRGSMGDRHRRGRTVTALEFDSGLRLVYKPRAMGIDARFQELLGWLNERGADPPFRTLRVLDRAGYGWMEFVEPGGCGDPAGVGRFYERLGGCLALLYALEANDFHYENLIAAGEHPVLVDLESLLQPRLAGDGAEDDVLDGTVLRVGLLPQRSWETEEREGVDLSGIGSVDGQLTPQAVPVYQGAGTDRMRLERRRLEMPEGANRPTLQGAKADPLEHGGSLAEGFARTYRLLAAHRHELRAEGAPLSRTADEEVRVILRPTRTYGLLLQESYHPHLLQDALDRDRHFDRLWAGAVRQPRLAEAIPSERADLEDGDIPYFTTRAGSRDAWDSRGRRIPGCFAESGLERVASRLDGLGEHDLRRQLWFIEASLATLAPGVEEAAGAAYPRVEAGNGDGPAPGRLLEGARAVGDRLEALALRGGEEVNWVGLTSTRGRSWRLEPVGLDLYGGLPGIALFLAELGEATGEERYTALARAATRTVRRRLPAARESLRSVGGYAGWGGIVYSLGRLAASWDDPELLDEAGAAVELLPRLVEEDEALDVVGGAAGCIGGLLSLHRTASRGPVLEVAALCGDLLLARAREMEAGVGWDTGGLATRPQAGFAHGAAGMAWALLELADATGEARYRDAALDAMAYERTLFVPGVGNWEDVRELPRPELARRVGGRQFMTTWCYGAPGIGLSRVRALSHLHTPELEAELRTAVETTLRDGFGTNHSLCHGDLGNLELPLAAAAVLGDPGLSARVDAVAAEVVEGISRHGWLCGTPRGVETPGLMMGLAGIGYQLLRLADPARVPSVLLLEPRALSAPVRGA